MARSSEKSLRKRFISEPLDIQAGNAVTQFDDPTYLGFNIIFDRMSPLFSKETTSVGESALSYLKQIDLSRAQRLESFIDGWLEIADSRSYYYQEIEGLDEIWSNNVAGGDPFKGSAKDAGVKVKCLEAIDLKMTALLSLYREACYDNKYRRIVIPENLRHFNVIIQVVEVRKFKRVMRKLGGKVQYLDERFPGEAMVDGALNNLNPFADNSGQKDSEITEMNFVNDNVSIVSFHLSECEFHANSGSELFAAGTILNNGGNGFAGTSFGFNYANMSEVNSFSGLNYIIDGTKKTQTESKLTRGLNALGNKEAQQDLLNELKGQAKEFGSAQFQNAADSLVDGARSIAQRIKLGNVYGLGNRLRATLSNPQALSNIAVGGAVAAANAFGGSVMDNVRALGDNIFPPHSVQSESGDLGDVFDQAPPGPRPLPGDENIFN